MYNDSKKQQIEKARTSVESQKNIIKSNSCLNKNAGLILSRGVIIIQNAICIFFTPIFPNYCVAIITIVHV